jgi:hypothetical protein
VEERSQRHGIGRLLLRAMLELFVEMRDRVDCIGMVVDAKQLGDRPVPVAMFMPVHQSAVATKQKGG